MTTFSVFFHHANTFAENIYLHQSEPVALEIPPRVVTGFKDPIIFLGKSMLIGNDLYQITGQELVNMTDEILRDLIKNSLNG
ncbi:MAG: hypothetical protein DI598_16870 [Pseudopedobacter saltans]|nr:MAG: hypothetical protein DI598_16870 [Pseudopedobacter saltans]